MVLLIKVLRPFKKHENFTENSKLLANKATYINQKLPPDNGNNKAQVHLLVSDQLHLCICACNFQMI